LYTQNPPNNGTQVLVGPLAIMINSLTTGFDIVTSNSINYGFMSAPIQGVFRLQTVNLATGECIIRGIIGQTPLSIVDIAIPIPTIAQSSQGATAPVTNGQSNTQSNAQSNAPVPTPVTTPIASAGKNSFIFLCLLVVLWITV